MVNTLFLGSAARKLARLEKRPVTVAVTTCLGISAWSQSGQMAEDRIPPRETKMRRSQLEYATGPCLSPEMQIISYWTTYTCRESHLWARDTAPRGQEAEQSTPQNLCPLFAHNLWPHTLTTQTPICTFPLLMWTVLWVKTGDHSTTSLKYWQVLEREMFLWLCVKS